MEKIKESSMEYLFNVTSDVIHELKNLLDYNKEQLNQLNKKTKKYKKIKKLTKALNKAIEKKTYSLINLTSLN